jgi:hypothetical protein
VLITVKNCNASHRSFWHFFPYGPTQPNVLAAPPELEVSLYLSSESRMITYFFSRLEKIFTRKLIFL